MNAFITGSRAYGKPGPKSDVDLVILTDLKTQGSLLELSGGKLPIRFGNLNLIVCCDETEFASWRVGTTALKIRANGGKPQDKKKAAKLLDKLRNLCAIPSQKDSE